MTETALKNLIDVAFIRIGSYKRKLTDFPEKERKLWHKTNPPVFETELAMKDVKDDEVLKILDIPSYLKIFNLNFPSSKKAILDKLCEEKIIQKSKNSSYHITNLGAILFADDLNVFENLSRKAIRIIFYKGKTGWKLLKNKS